MSIPLLRFAAPVATQTQPARTAVFGVGGGGTRAVNAMRSGGLPGARFFAVNTDAAELEQAQVPGCLIGRRLTGGEGAFADPWVGRAAAQDARERIAALMADAEVVYIVAGLGGGTGTGAAPVIARLARERGARTVAVVTQPYFFEGKRRRACAETGLDHLRRAADTLITIPCQNLLRQAASRSTMREVFELADQALYKTVQGATTRL